MIHSFNQLLPSIRSITSLKASKEEDFDALLNAIEFHNEKHSGKSISLTFCYSEDDESIPKTVRGYPLGNMIRKIRYSGLYNEDNYRDKLEKVGVYIKAKDKIDTVLKALEIYFDLFGDVNVDRTFIVTEDLKSYFPENFIGMKLGMKSAALRSNRHTLSDEVIKRLDSFGFRWRPSQDNFMLFFKALQIFKQLHGHLDVPREYVVPFGDDNYDVKMYGMKLGIVSIMIIFVNIIIIIIIGRKVSNVRTRGDFLKNNRDELVNIGLCIESNVYDNRHWDEFIEAFKTFFKIHGHINVPFDYIVPSGTSYPRKCHGIKLGYRVHNIKYRGDFVIENSRCREMLEEYGFTFRFKQ